MANWDRSAEGQEHLGAIGKLMTELRMPRQVA